ncbi:MAG: crotonase/enoyl-CoA hydratase family protein [Actinobacteria bacterium]|nr:crotonase/enoyl-CoA hydratase family protein [Actinomycetota bacterium]
MPSPDPERVSVEVSDGVADVRLTRAGKHNGLDWAMFGALNAAIDEVGADDEARVAVLSGEGPSFCAGLDFKAFMTEGGDGEAGFARRDGEPENFAQRSAHGWRSLPVPVIAALHGNALGGGLQLALAADVRIAAPGTRMSVMEVRYGLIPDMGLSQTLPGLVRDDVARELTYTGRVLEAEEALALGLVTRVSDDPRAEAMELAAQIAARSPEAIRSAKRLLNEASRADAAPGLALEEELQRALLGSPAQLAAVAEAFGAPAS